RLEKKGALKSWEEPITIDDPWDTDFTPPSNILNSEQKLALEEIWRWLVTGKFVAGLLHGVTGSGKTEVYLGAIEAALARGKTAILLVPEIALTLWLGRLVRARFGDQVAILHSALSDNERAREWWRVRNGEARVVVGTLSRARYGSLSRTPRRRRRAARLGHAFHRDLSQRRYGKIPAVTAYRA